MRLLPPTPGQAIRLLPLWVMTLVGGASAQSAPRPEPREVLALTSTPRDDRDDGALAHVHALLQMPLNYLGMTVRIRGLDDDEPAMVDPTITRAILLHLDGSGDEPPEWLLPWLERQRQHPGLRFVHIGSIDALANVDRPGLARWLDDFGLEYRATTVSNPLRIAYRAIAPERCAFEAEPAVLRHAGPVNRAADNTPWITTSDRRTPGDDRHPVVTGPWGGLALDPWIAQYGTGNGDRRWHLDLFAFFRTVLGLEEQPAPDPSVTWGRRMFLLHVDGDGFESLSTVEPGNNSAGVFGRAVVDRFHIPMTLSVIVRSLTGDLHPAAPTAEMAQAQALFATPWVEAASHTVLHPLDWRRTLNPRSLPRTVVWYDTLANYRHTMTAEVTASVDFIDRHLTAPDRPCRAVFWSGAANPTAAVVRACRDLDCENLNGGTYRWDGAHDSVGYVVPWGLQQDDTFQVYCGAANENVFDGFYTTLPAAFGHIHATLENTGSPRLLKPANIYAHFYSAEHAPRLRALLELIEEWAERRPTVPVFASTYAAAVRGAQTDCRISRTDDGWQFDGFDTCRTVRFEDAARAIDWHRSPGVLGSHAIGGRRYLQLAPGGGRLTWSDTPSPAPHFEQADHVLTEAARDARGIRCRSAAWRPRLIVLAGFPVGAEVEVHVGARTTSQAADSDGRVIVRLPAGDDLVEVRTR